MINLHAKHFKYFLYCAYRGIALSSLDILDRGKPNLRQFGKILLRDLKLRPPLLHNILKLHILKLHVKLHSLK